jgi:hypothetical protein
MDKTRDAAETRTEPRQPVAAVRAAKSGATPPAATAGATQTQATQFTDWASI